MRKDILKDKYHVYPLPSAAKLFEFLEKVTPELILLDIEMPELNGYEAIEKLKANEKTAAIPVIFLTANTNEKKGRKLGAVDYITKPFTPEFLINCRGCSKTSVLKQLPLKTAVLQAVGRKTA